MRTRASSAGLGVAPTEQVVCVLPTPPARLPGAVPIVVKSSSTVAALHLRRPLGREGGGERGQQRHRRARRGARRERLHLRGVEARLHVAPRAAARSAASSGRALKSGPKRPLKFCMPAPPLNHVSHTGTTDGVTCEPIAARNGSRICSRMSVAVPSGNGQQKSGGHAAGMSPQRVEQAPAPAEASMPPPSGASWRSSVGGCSRAARSAASMRAIAPSPDGRLREARLPLAAALVAQPVRADDPAALAALARALGLGLRQLRGARQQPGHGGVALAALHRGQRAGAQRRRQRGELVARAAARHLHHRRERGLLRRAEDGARFLLQLESQGRHGPATIHGVRPLCEPQPRFRRA